MAYKNIIKLTGLQNNPYIIIVTLNLIPLFSYFIFEWKLAEIALFYAFEISVYELVMLPTIVMVSYVYAEEEFLNRILRVLMTAFIAAVHLFLFFMVLYFLMHIAFSITAASVKMGWERIDVFLKRNIVPLLVTASCYFYNFYRDKIKLKDHKRIKTNIQLFEIVIVHMIVLLSIAFIEPVIILRSMGLDIYGNSEAASGFRLVLFIIIIVIKTVIQLFIMSKMSVKVR